MPTINSGEEDEKERKTTKVKMYCNPGSAASDTYKLKMATFKNGQQEDFLLLLKNFNTMIDGAVTTTVAGRINYLCMILHGETSQDFDKLKIQKNGTTNSHLKHIQ